MGRKLQCETQQRDGVQPATLELPRCRFAWTTRWMDRGLMGWMTGRMNLAEASFLIPTSFNICNVLERWPNTVVLVFLSCV